MFQARCQYVIFVFGQPSQLAWDSEAENQNRELSWYVNMKDIICEQGCSEIENRTLASEVIVKASWGTNQPLTFPHRQIQFTLPNPFVICNVSESVPKTAKLSNCILSLLSSGPAANM